MLGRDKGALYRIVACPAMSLLSGSPLALASRRHADAAGRDSGPSAGLHVRQFRVCKPPASYFPHAGGQSSAAAGRGAADALQHRDLLLAAGLLRLSASGKPFPLAHTASRSLHLRDSGGWAVALRVFPHSSSTPHTLRRVSDHPTTLTALTIAHPSSRAVLIAPPTPSDPIRPHPVLPPSSRSCPHKRSSLLRPRRAALSCRTSPSLARRASCSPA